MDRLTSIDAGFLAQEREGSHMHIGSVMLVEGPAPHREGFIEHISSRLHLVPRYRQKLAFPRLELGRPLWVDDPRFNIDYHVRVTALPEPGTDEARQLLEAWGSATSEMAEAGVLIDCGPLQPPSVSTTVSVRDGEALFTDGPAAEIKAWYPDIGAFHKAYLVTFPKKTPDGQDLLGPQKKLTLHIAERTKKKPKAT